MPRIRGQFAGGNTGRGRNGAPSTVILPPTHPWWLNKEFRGLLKDYFVYAKDWRGTTVLPAGGTLALNITINGDSHFECVSTCRIVTLTDDTTFIAQAPILVRIEDTGSGRIVSDQPLHIENWFGTAEQPKYWDMPKLYPANSTITLTLQNLDAANAYNVQLAFHGFKIFGIGQ